MNYFEAIEIIKKNYDYNNLPCPDIHNPWVRIYYNVPIEQEPNYYNTLGQFKKNP
jgi:hypothetical protein